MHVCVCVPLISHLLSVVPPSPWAPHPALSHQTQFQTESWESWAESGPPELVPVQPLPWGMRRTEATLMVGMRSQQRKRKKGP